MKSGLDAKPLQDRLLRWLACFQISTIRVLSQKFQKSNIGWPQQPLTENMQKFNMIFNNTVKTFFSKHQNKVILVLKLLNSRI